MWPAHGKRSIVGGCAVAISMVFASRPCTMRPGRAGATPVRHSSACSRFASVADRPHVRSAGRASRSRASASSTCTPRLLASSSCHSSTTTASRCATRSRQSARDRSSVRLSGVVTRIVGSRRSWRARTEEGVSPVRRSTVQAGCSAAAARAMASVVSAASARSGVIQSSVSGGAASPAAARPGPSSSGPISAAYVLPMPVGACTSPDSPAAYADQTSSWNANVVQPCAANHARAGSNGSGRRGRGGGGPVQSKLTGGTSGPARHGSDIECNGGGYAGRGGSCPRLRRGLTSRNAAWCTFRPELSFARHRRCVHHAAWIAAGEPRRAPTSQGARHDASAIDVARQWYRGRRMVSAAR